MHATKLTHITREELEALYNKQGMTTGEIGEIFGVSDEAIRYHLKRLGIPRRGKPWSEEVIRSKLTRGELEKLYINEHLSMAKIAKLFGVGETTIHSRLKEYSIERRDLSTATIIYPRRDFSGDLSEKAYLIGFRQGDLWVGPANDGLISTSISVGCATSRDEQIKLIEELFSPYTHVSITPGHKGEIIQYNLQFCLNRSFDFLLPKEDCIPSWIMGDDKHFVAFLAGYIDAEGSFTLLNDGTSRFALGSNDVQILHQIHTILTSRFRIDCPPPRLSAPKNSLITGGYRLRKDIWTLIIARKIALFRLCTILDPFLKHSKRRKDMGKVLENVTKRGIKVSEL